MLRRFSHWSLCSHPFSLSELLRQSRDCQGAVGGWRSGTITSWGRQALLYSLQRTDSPVIDMTLTSVTLTWCVPCRPTPRSGRSEARSRRRRSSTSMKKLTLFDLSLLFLLSRIIEITGNYTCHS